MLEAIVGSEGAERVLMFLTARGKGYVKEIADQMGMRPNNVRNHLLRMERDGLLISEEVGRTRLYTFNPRYAFSDEIQTLLRKALSLLPADIRDDLMHHRTRPRRTGKPL